MKDNESTGRARKSYERGFFRRNWPVLTAGLLAALVMSAALGYWWLVPAYVERLVNSVFSSVSKLTDAKVGSDSVELEGLNRLVLKGISVGPKDRPVLYFDTVELLIDPFSFREGLPTVVKVRGDGVHVAVFRHLDGSDNLSPLVARVREKLGQKGGAGGGRSGRLAALLRQTPELEWTNVHFTVDIETEEPGVVERVVDFSHGVVSARNPGISMMKKGYVLEADFDSDKKGGTAHFSVDVDLGEKSLQGIARFEPPMTVSAHGHSAEIEEVRLKTGEFVEVILGKVALRNPVQTPDDFRYAILAGLEKLGLESAGDQVERILDPEKLLEPLFKQAAGRLAQAKYSPEVWAHYQSSLLRLIRRIMGHLVQEAQEPHLLLDRAHLLYSMGETQSDRAVERVKVTMVKGDVTIARVEVKRNKALDTIRADFDLSSPSQLFHLRGEAVKDRDAIRVQGEVQLSLDDPHVRLDGDFAYDDGQWDAHIQGQLRSEDPPLAFAANLGRGASGWTGELQGTFAVPGLFQARRLSAVVQRNEWSADVEGLLTLPRKLGDLEFATALDSKQGVKRASFESHEDIAVALGEFDVLLRKGRFGRDSVIHLEDIAVTQAGGDRSRALLSVSDLALHLSRHGEDLINTLREADLDSGPEVLLGKVIKRVEIIEPVMIIRQPPKLVVDEGDAPEDEESASDKIDDALRDVQPTDAVMDESFRKFLSAFVVGTSGRVDRFVQLLVRLGDRFPLEEVAVKEGRFEYSDAVSPQDRILTDLSNFNASIRKVKTPANYGGKFSIEAEFSTPVVNRDASASLKADVDLSTGDLTGKLSVEQLALFPYRFFLPATLGPTPRTRLEDAAVEFAYGAQEGRFSIWGRGRLVDFNIISRRFSTKPLEHITIDVEIGTDKESGVSFDLPAMKVWTNSAIRFSMAKIQRFGLEFMVDASVAEYPKIEAHLSLPETPINDLLLSLPRGLVSRIRDLDVAGELGFTVNFIADSRDLGNLTFKFNGRENGVSLQSPGRIANFHKIAGPFRHHPPTSPNRTLHIGDGADWVPLDRISPWLVLAVTTCEDGSFFRHDGFNTYQIKMSIIRNLEKGKFVRGASTITMQLMKNLFLSHEKTVARKFQEVILTWLVEKEIRKDRIIELYLNLIEWGDGIYGVKEACDYYFDGLPPQNLSPLQAAFLASFIPYPRPFNSQFKKGMKGAKRSTRWDRWWSRRLRIVKRIVKAMVDNCSSIERKCPDRVDFCRMMHRTCEDPGGELRQLDTIQSLDEIFRPREPAPVPLPDAGGGLDGAVEF